MNVKVIFHYYVGRRVLGSIFNGISTYLDYSMPKQSFQKDSCRSIEQMTRVEIRGFIPFRTLLIKKERKKRRKKERQKEKQQQGKKDGKTFEKRKHRFRKKKM